MDIYNPDRDITPTFLSRVDEWLRDRGECLIIVRYLRCAGAKDFFLCTSGADFRALVEWVPEGADIEVFRDRFLPIRGTVDDQFVARAIASIPDGIEYLVAKLEFGLPTHRERWAARTGGMGMTHIDLREELENWRGVCVAVGLLPDFNVADHEGLISASKGGIDGPR